MALVAGRPAPMKAPTSTPGSYLTMRRLVGAVGAVDEFCVTLIWTPAMLMFAARMVGPPFAGIV